MIAPHQFRIAHSLLHDTFHKSDLIDSKRLLYMPPCYRAPGWESRANIFFKRAAIVVLATAFISSFSLGLLRHISRANADAESFQIVDPVPALLSGPAITTDANALATMGTPVQGIAAGGVSQIVLLATAASAGQHFTFEVFNDQSQQSSSISNDGALGAVGSANVNQSQLTVDSVTTSQGRRWEAVLR